MFESINTFDDLKLVDDNYIKLLLKRIDTRTIAEALVSLSYNKENLLDPITNTTIYREQFKDCAEDDLKEYQEIYNSNKDHIKTLKNGHKIVVKDDLKDVSVFELKKKKEQSF